MKTIGLVGGMTPESTKVFYEALIQGARQPDGDPLRNPVIIIYSLNLTRDLERRSSDSGARHHHHPRRCDSRGRVLRSGIGAG